MFEINYKIILIIVAIVIIIVLAYIEISSVKESLTVIDNKLKSQTSTITTDVSQCVDRIEKISKAHILELQNINKINSQQINKISSIYRETDNETEGLSRNYISPREVVELHEEKKEIEEKPKINNDETKKEDDNEFYMSNDSSKLPVYEPIGVKTFNPKLLEQEQPQQIQVEKKEEIKQETKENSDDELVEYSGEADVDEVSADEEEFPTFQSEKKSPILSKDVEYTYQELRKIAKKNNIPTAFKADGKLRPYKKSELFEILSKIEK